MKPIMKCIKCENEVKREDKTGVLINGLELIAYAHHASEFDMGVSNPDSKAALLCICDTCFKSNIGSAYTFSSVRSEKPTKYKVD